MRLAPIISRIFLLGTTSAFTLNQQLVRSFAKLTSLVLLTVLLGSCWWEEDSCIHVVKGFTYELSIDGPETQSNVDPRFQSWLDSDGNWYLEGDGFLPPGTTCCQTVCHNDQGWWGPNEGAYEGYHELTWENVTTGEEGIISKGEGLESHLSWWCYCNEAPRWVTRVPVSPGVNRIVITQISPGIVQTDEVLVIRE